MRQAPVIRLMVEGDYPKLQLLWHAAGGGLQLRDTDTPQALARFLRRNPASSFVACAGTRLVGGVLAGHDGWRGYLYHLAVKPDCREKGLGARLVNAAVEAISGEGIPKIHSLVKHDNLIAQQFWEACGFVQRDELLVYSR